MTNTEQTQPPAGAVRALHTPTIAPIQAVSEYLLNAKGERIGELFGNMDERIPAAREIVRAVNAYEQTQADVADLREALTKSLTWMKTYKRFNSVGDSGPLAQDIAEARAVLARHAGK